MIPPGPVRLKNGLAITPGGPGGVPADGPLETDGRLGCCPPAHACTICDDMQRSFCLSHYAKILLHHHDPSEKCVYERINFS